MASLVFVAGDPSGDAHAASLIRVLRERDPSLTIDALGGPLMRQAGARLLDELTRASSIGPFDAARHLNRFLRAKRRLDDHLRRARPDLAVLVDFGDFNLPVIAPLLKRRGVPVLYYISPQLWAWGGFRLRWVRESVDRMAVFFPFEEALYRRAGVAVTWVGHPLVDEARPSLPPQEALQRFGLSVWRRTVGLLPGSREAEVRRHLPLLLSAAAAIAWRMPGVQFLLPKAPAIAPETIAAHLRAGPGSIEVHIAEGPLPNALQLMEGAIVASGTATLQAALAEVPMAVVYRTSWPTYLAARLAVRIPQIALVNVVAGRRVVPEFVQHRARARAIAAAMIGLLRNPHESLAMKQALREVNARLGPPGAVERTADVVREMLKRP